jgi:hypothetical protein
MKYNTMQGTSKTFEQAMASEISIGVENLLQFLHWPYMFHQVRLKTQYLSTRHRLATASSPPHHHNLSSVVILKCRLMLECTFTTEKRRVICNFSWKEWLMV